MKGARRAGAETYRERHAARQFKLTLLLGVMAFGVALAWVVGARLSNLGAVVLTGAVAGVATSIPVSLVLVALLRGREARRESGRRERYPANDRYLERGRWDDQWEEDTPWGWSETPRQQMPVIVVAPAANGAGRAPNRPRPIYAGRMSVQSDVVHDLQVVDELGYESDEDYRVPGRHGEGRGEERSEGPGHPG